jgi:serine/threonine protein kinase
MGCTHSTDVIRPNMFQTKLCMHHKTSVLETYRILGELGRGAFGVVEKVEHLKTHKHYAMKTVTFSTGSKRHEFEKEMDILRVLHHPNIVRMLETFEDDHHFYIIMELSPGGTVSGIPSSKTPLLCGTNCCLNGFSSSWIE